MFLAGRDHTKDDAQWMTTGDALTWLSNSIGPSAHVTSILALDIAAIVQRQAQAAFPLLRHLVYVHPVIDPRSDPFGGFSILVELLH